MVGAARKVALDCLMAGEKQGAWSDGYLRNAIRRAQLSGRDAALATQLTFGVLQNRILLDWHLSRLSSTAIDKLEPAVRDNLRLGLYQMSMLDRIPAHAAVNDAVELTKCYAKNPRAASFVNAVLRTFERECRQGLPQPDELWVRYSHPKWIVKEFACSVPTEELEELLKADNAQPPTQAQVNTLQTTTEELLRELEREGVKATAHPWMPNCLELEELGNLERLAAFQEGRFYVQDVAAKLSVLAAEPKHGMKVLDVCAAPGGKSVAAAIAMQDQGEIISCDLHSHKIKLISDAAARLKLNSIHAMERDGRKAVPEWEKRFDLVIVDAPCSGLGVIRKKPDIRYKDPKPLERLPEIQLDILKNAANYVRSGGVLLYSTCTVLSRENEAVVEAFLKENTDFACKSFTLHEPIGEVSSGMLTLWPHRYDTDGFFIAKLVKR